MLEVKHESACKELKFRTRHNALGTTPMHMCEPHKSLHIS